MGLPGLFSFYIFNDYRGNSQEQATNLQYFIKKKFTQVEGYFLVPVLPAGTYIT